MIVDVFHNDEEKDWIVYWDMLDEESLFREVSLWCDKHLSNNWYNGFDDLNYIRVFSEKDLTLVLLRWL
jgi:hypothetical protein